MSEHEQLAREAANRERIERSRKEWSALRASLDAANWRTVETFAIFGSAAPSTLRDIYQGDTVIAESVPFEAADKIVAAHNGVEKP